MTQVNLFITLLVAYQFKHVLADFFWQTRWMQQKDGSGWTFLGPLLLHCGVHAGLTLVICLVVAPAFAWLALVDFGVHAVMDRIKAGPRYLGRFRDPRTHAYWNSFGVDQMVHHLTHLGLAWVLAFHA